MSSINWSVLPTGTFLTVMPEDLQARIDTCVKCMPSGVDVMTYELEGENVQIPLFVCLPPNDAPMPKLLSKHPFKAEFEAIIFQDNPSPDLHGFLFLTATPTTPGQTKLYEVVFAMPYCLADLLKAAQSRAMAIEVMPTNGMLEVEFETPIFEIPTEPLKKCLIPFMDIGLALDNPN